MDEKEFKKALHTVNPQSCVFEKTILSCQGRCPYMVKRNIAERETAGCISAGARGECVAWLGLLRERAMFALGTTDRANALPHAKAMRLQVGSLRGLRSVVAGDTSEASPVEDIHGLIQRVRAQYETLEQIPFQQIIQHVAAFRGRRRSASRRRGH